MAINTSRRRHAINYYEWCQDHNKPLEVNPVRRCRRRRSRYTARSQHPHQRRLVSAAAPIWVPMPPTRADRTQHACIPPSGTQAQLPAGERGFAFMWHSHNEREITTNNVFPGGMMMMMLVDSREFVIDESN